MILSARISTSPFWVPAGPGSSRYHLGNAGVSTYRNIDHAGDWVDARNWNRYPGIQCDNDAYCYLPLLEETGFMPSKKYADGHEIHDYFKLIAARFNLGENALFHTLVTSLRWDEGIKRWRVATNRGDDIRARFVIMANGLLNIPSRPTSRVSAISRQDVPYRALGL